LGTTPPSSELVPLTSLYSSLNVLSLTNLTEISCNSRQPIFSSHFNDLSVHPCPRFFDTKPESEHAITKTQRHTRPRAKCSRIWR
jgi:hypothetical protein